MMRPLWLGTLLCLSVPLIATRGLAQQNPDGILPVTQFADPFLLLLRDPVVQKELKLTDSQVRALTALNDEMDAPLWTTRNQTAERGEAIFRETADKTRERLGKILNPPQLRRLREIELWTIGMRAFLRPEVVERLAIGDEQLAKIREVVESTQEQVNQLQKRAQEGEPLSVLEQEHKSLRQEEQKQVAALLTREQRAAWVALRGASIDVTKLGRVKFKAPELRGKGEWVNSKPLTMQFLQGNVVALHFWTFG